MSSSALQQFDLGPLFKMLSAIMDDDTEIEVTASKELLLKSNDALATSLENKLSNDFVKVMTHTSANPICAEILRLPFNWMPPETSKSKLYREHSHFKAHVELLGPDGLIKSDVVRLGLYGHCQNKPPCPTASWKLTSVTCPILYPFVTSKPAQKSSSLR